MPVNARVYWKGFLRLSLVTINVELYSAVDTAHEISFRQIHKPTGKRVRYEKVVPGVGEIDSQDIVKGYEIDNDVYVVLEPDEIKAVQLESEKALELVQFVEASEIDPRYFERPYYITPADAPSTDGYRVIAEALRRSGKIGLGQLTLRGREYLVAVAPLQDGLVLELLRYAADLRDAAAFFDELPKGRLDKELVELAVELINRKVQPFDPSQFTDHYDEALRALIQQKSKGRKIVAHDQKPAHSAQVIDLVEALRRSIDGGGKQGGRKAPAGRAKTRKAGRR